MIRIATIATPLVLLEVMGCNVVPDANLPGRETGACVEGACFAGLECLSDLCVNAPGSSSGDDEPASTEDGDGPRGSTHADSTDGLAGDDTSSSGGTGPAVATEGGDPSTGPGGDPDTGSGSTSALTQGPDEMDGGSSSDGGPVTEQPATGMYAHCHAGFLDNCTADAPTCLHIGGQMQGYCTVLGCANPALDCDPAPGGTAPVYCTGVTQTLCALDCSGGQQCPLGMTCEAITIEPFVPVEICM